MAQNTAAADSWGACLAKPGRKMSVARGSRHACRYLLAAERPSAMEQILRAEDVPGASSKMGLGFSCWENLSDALPPTFAAAQKLYEQAGENVRSGDTVLDTAAAKTHLEACQALLAAEPDIDGFLSAHDAALRKQK